MAKMMIKTGFVGVAAAALLTVGGTSALADPIAEVDASLLGVNVAANGQLSDAEVSLVAGADTGLGTVDARGNVDVNRLLGR
ncbi:hypothetical protein N8J89_20515 [Crossiella sp. CA-258035]|uniref:hypothetical protein n=1 Tax=Crossiella sp. CA-258035 TaxID=2981138 RepID=UPI0024BC41A7|nr:hypothetical protein [Crossiella sp. CA-258035]WHT23368.1 hypothetical protein N8J89_20515 [Crossiella sp. CA-258035]